ncbi:hypothetical protein CAPTEDRAFT_143104, partial [Capitella teleta]
MFLGVTCGFPGSPSKGHVSLSGSKHYYGVTAKYTCLTGYSLRGSSTRVCQNSGKWSSSLPTCQIKTCGNPGIPTHGSAQGSNFEYGRSVVFACQTGYRLNGHSTLTCGANSKWSHTRPTCQIVMCPAPQTPSNGAVSAPSRSYQSVASFSCKSGYVIKGSSRRACQANTQWSGSQPTCNPVSCGNPGSLTNGVKQGSTYTLNNKVFFKCQPGYTLNGATEITCQSSGFWSGSKPSCSEILCPNLPPPSNAYAATCDRRINSVCETTCNDGYVVSAGSERRECLSDGTWAGSALGCTG